jgi:hypothetical protein
MISAVEYPPLRPLLGVQAVRVALGGNRLAVDIRRPGPPKFQRHSRLKACFLNEAKHWTGLS